jgi:hypothetical protein
MVPPASSRTNRRSPSPTEATPNGPDGDAVKGKLATLAGKDEAVLKKMGRVRKSESMRVAGFSGLSGSA